MIANDKTSQNPDKFDNQIDNFSKLFAVWMFTKEKKILATYDPTKLQHIRGRPFLVYPCVITCYKRIPIKNSVRAQDDKFLFFNR